MEFLVSEHAEIMFTFFFAYVSLLYTNINSCAINNGHPSQALDLQRGVRQGCPLSPYPFLLGAEVLGLMIRQDRFFKGIPLNDVEV